MTTEYKLKFTYDSKESLEKYLMSASGLSKKELENGTCYEYYSSYGEKKLEGSLYVESDGVFLRSYGYFQYKLDNLAEILCENYDDLEIIDLTLNKPYALEYFDITELWLDFSVLNAEELNRAYRECVSGHSWHCKDEVQKKYILRWLKNKTTLLPDEFHFIFSILLKLPYLLQSIPLSLEQMERVKDFALNNVTVHHELLMREIVRNKLSKKLLYQVVQCNEAYVIKAFVNQTNNREYLEYILEHHHLDASKVNNIIRGKLNLKIHYKNKETKKKIKNQNITPARLHVLLAKESSLAVIVRRMPSKKVCTILWDRDKDTFTMGDCVTKLVARYSDLSPDGKHLFYYAGIRDNYWIAICKAPVLRDMLVQMDTSYGGMFVNNHDFKIHNPNSYRFTSESFVRSSQFHLKNSTIEGEGDNYDRAYLSRLVRDGWEVDKVEYGENYHRKAILKKKVSGDWFLEKTVLSKKEQYRLRRYNRDEEVLDSIYWDWAEYDKGELLFTKNGCLYRLKDIPNIEKAILIKDLNTIKTRFNKQPFTRDGSHNLQKGIYYNDMEALQLAADEGQDDAYFYLADKNESTFEKKDELYTIGMNLLKAKETLSYWHCSSYAEFLFEHNKFEEALDIYLLSLTLHLNNDEKANAYIYLTVLFSYAKDEKKSQMYELKAKEFFRKDRMDYAYQLATRYKKTEEYEKAYEHYLLDIKANEEDATKGYGREERYDELEKVCSMLNKKLLTVYKALTEVYPNDRFIMQRLSFAYIEAKDIAAASLVSIKILELYKGSRDENILSSFAEKLYEYEHYDLALVKFEELLLYNSYDFAKYNNYIGVIYDKKEEYKKAISYFKVAMEKDSYSDMYKTNYELMVARLEDN